MQTWPLQIAVAAVCAQKQGFITGLIFTDFQSNINIGDWGKTLMTDISLLEFGSQLVLVFMETMVCVPHGLHEYVNKV